MKTALLAIAALTLGTTGIAATPSRAIEVRDVNVHLFLTPSGELSNDIAAFPGFSSWNFRAVVPIDPKDEEFKSYLIKVRLGATGSLFQKGSIGSITVRSLKTKKVLYSSFIANLYIPQEGQTVLARLVDGYVCEPVEVIASVGKSRVTKRLNFECGE